MVRKSNQQNQHKRRNRVIGIVLAVLVLTNMIAAEVVFGVVFSRYEESVSTEYEGLYRQVNIPEGKNHIMGYLFGENNEKGTIIMAHGIHATARRMFEEAELMSEDGFQVLVVDGLGCGSSDGRNGVGLGQRRVDILAAMDYLEEAELADSFLLYGHSAGAYSALMLATDSRVKAIASVAAFDSQAETMTAFATRYAGPIVYMGYPFMYLKNLTLFGMEGAKKAHDRVEMAEIPILLIEAENDNVIPQEISVSKYLHDRVANKQLTIQKYEIEGDTPHNRLLEETQVEVLRFFNQYAR